MIPPSPVIPTIERRWTMKALTLYLALAMALMLPAATAHAEVLLVERVQRQAGMPLPTRGSTMSEVEARFGVPTRKYAAISGPNSTGQNPPITRWAYPGFSVYFEHDHVVDAVANKAAPNEVGPKPIQQ
jgi:hypothetical protein